MFFPSLNSVFGTLFGEYMGGKRQRFLFTILMFWLLGSGVFVWDFYDRCLASEGVNPWASYCAYLDRSGSQAVSDHNLERSLGLCEVIDLAINVAPELEAHRFGIEANEGRINQAFLRQNPTITASLEDFIGSGSKATYQSAEWTVSFSQPLDLAGKRSRRQAVARAEKDLAQVLYELEIKDLIKSVKTSFLEILGDQELLTLAERRRSLAQDFVETAKQRAIAGGGSAVEEVKAALSLSTSELEYEQAARELDLSQRRLAARLGQPGAKVQVRGELEPGESIPVWQDIEKMIERSPDIQKAQLTSQARRATVSREERERISDLSLSAGLNHTRLSKDTGFMVGFSLPMPVFDRNQGAILEAQKNLAASHSSERAELLRAHVAVKTAYQDMAITFDRSKRLKGDVIPRAERGLEASNKAFRLGKLSYLDVLDSQRALFDAREQYVKALTTYHSSRADLERYIGRGLGEFSANKASLE